VLALFVVACHADGLYGADHFTLPAVAAVAIFFVLSGHVLTRAYDGRYAAFLVRRAVRLWPAYAIGMLAGCLLLRQMPDWTQLFWLSWVPHFPADLMSIPDPPEWSMSIEAAAMLFMPAIAWFGGSAWRALLILPAWVAFSHLDWHFNWCGFLLIGAALSRFTLHSEVLESRPAQWLGKVSYSLYVSHWIVIRALAIAFGHFGALAGLPVSLAVAWVLWRFVEAPSIALSRRLGRPAARTSSVIVTVEAQGANAVQRGAAAVSSVGRLWSSG
jgi:peptidoglycan/LPS O-acetylase OafA/YrhL